MSNVECTCGKGVCNLHENLTPKQAYMIYDLQDIDEILWGGEAGGGKSEGLLMYALRRRLECPGSAGLMMRRTFPDLDKSLIRKSQKYFAKYAKWSEAKRKWTFKNGSIQDFGYCESDKDVYQYQSAEYDDIEIDEITQWTEFQYLYLMSRLRSTSGKYKTQMRSATNPGNIGHLWVKARFVDVARDKKHESFDEILGTNKTRYFLPAGLDDNTLMTLEQRIEYRSWLNQLPEDQKQMLMKGNWDYVIGAAFAELKREVHMYDPKDHPVPKWAKVFMSYDFGFGAPFSIGWWWVDYDGRMWRFAEWYGWNGKPNKGLRMSPSVVAGDIKKIEKKMDVKVDGRVAGPDIFSKTPNMRGGGQGPSVAEMFSESGIYFTPGDPDRLQGKAQVHERFKVPENYDSKNPLTYPMIMVSSECKNWWRTVPVLSTGDWGTPKFDDIEDKQEDHCFTGDTLVCTDRGKIPIKSLVEKEGKVLTVFGQWTDFWGVKKTRTDAEIIEITYSDGVKVKCTPDHKFLTVDGRWVKAVDMIDEVSYTSISNLKEDTVCKSLSLVKRFRNLVAEDTTDAVSISKTKAKDFIEWFGDITTVRLVKAGMSTTKMMTDQITALKTWYYGQEVPISLITGRSATLPLGNKLCAEVLLHGIERKKAESGTVSIMKKISVINYLRKSVKFVNNVAINMKSSSLQKKWQDSVRVIANKAFIVSRELMRNPENVLFAVKNGQLTSTEKQELVALLVRENFKVEQNLKTVKSIRKIPTEDVYCLVAEGTHSFAIESGIMVSNCYDETKIACMSRPISPIHDKPKENFIQKIMGKVKHPVANEGEEWFKDAYNY